MTKLRFLGFLAAGIAALLGVVLIIVWLTVDPNNFKPRIAAAVKDSTGRDLKLAGDIKLSVFPWVALELGPASLGNPPGFGAEPFLSFSHASVRVRLLPLLHKRLEIAKLEVDGLDVRLRKNARGEGNWQLTGAKAETPAKADAVHTASLPLESIANIQVQKGRLSYEGISVENIKVETGSLTGDRHIPVTVAFDLQRAPSGEQLSLNAKLDLSEGNGGQLQFGDVSTSGTLNRPGDGRPAHWELTAANLSLDLGKQTLALPAFALSYSNAHLTGSVQGTKILDDLSVTGSLTLEPLVLREFAPRLGFALPTTRDPKALSQLSATMSFSYDAKAMALSHLQARLDDTTLQGNFKLLSGESDAIQFDLAADQIDFDRYRAPESAAAAHEPTPAAKDDKSAKPLDANGTLAIKSAHVAKLDVADLRVTLSAKDKVIHLYPLEAQLDGGRYSGNITWDAKGAIPILSVDEHLAGVDMARLLANTAGKGRLSGRATINVKATARGADVDADLKTLNGNLDANLADGAMEGIDVAYELSLAQALLNKSTQASASNSGRTKFDTFKTSMQIANGVAQTQDLTIASQALKVTGQGSANLATKAVDFKLLASIITAPARTTEIPLKVTGTYASLSVKPDIEGLAKDQLKQKLQDVLKKEWFAGAFQQVIEPSIFAQRLLGWFALHGRHTLPWQENPTPYRVWISEIMLQQTQVATVIPYYARFMARFADVESLAAASLDEVLHLWTGLGYYARARNLQACAQTLVAQYDGDFPQDLAAVMQLPGIGRSTAGAILAISRGQRHAILDGNVKRALSRVFGIAGDPSSNAVLAELWKQSEACTPADDVAAYTQAIMDLGATVCTRSRPACTLCPMAADCVAAREGRQKELPGKKLKRARASREATLLIAKAGSNGSTAVLLERRPPSGIWGGLWSLPQFASASDALTWCSREFRAVSHAESLPPIEHAFTHFDLRLTPVVIQCVPDAEIQEEGDRLWYRLESPPRIGLPQPISRLFERLRKDLLA